MLKIRSAYTKEPRLLKTCVYLLINWANKVIILNAVFLWVPNDKNKKETSKCGIELMLWKFL